MIPFDSVAVIFEYISLSKYSYHTIYSDILWIEVTGHVRCKSRITLLMSRNTLIICRYYESHHLRLDIEQIVKVSIFNYKIYDTILQPK